MKSGARTRFSVLLVAGIGLCAPSGAHALVITDSTLTISNILITSASGTVQFDPWTAEASATANNSLGQSDGQFDSTAINLGSTAQASATVTWATAQGPANASNLTAKGSSAVNLPGILNQADSTWRGSLFTSFTVTGCTPGNSVDVTFSMDLSGSQHGFADALGSFTNELTASLELDGSPLLFFDTILSGGPGFPDTTKGISQNLNAKQTLTFGTPYFVFIQADSESNGQNVVPAPGTLSLVLACLGALAGLGMRRRVANVS